MDLPQAADALGLAASTLRWQIKNRKLRARKMGGRWYVSDEEVARYARENRQQPKGEYPMTLSERLATCPVCQRRQGEAYVGRCTNYRFHVHGQVPEWRRRMNERLAKNGRVAEKALDR